MKNNFLRVILFILFLLQNNLVYCTQTIIWDLGGVLFNPDKFSMAYNEIGLKDILWYSIRDLQNPKKMHQRIFEILYTIGEQPCEHVSYAYGLPLPQIMCDWLKGKQSPEAILATIYEKINELEKQNFFVSTREKNVLKKTITTMFDPIILAKYMLPKTQACSLLNEVMQDPQCEQYILSNWDPYSFAELYKSSHGKKIFSFFKPEHILISGECGFMKPNIQIFTHMIARFNLNPSECVFIDDQLENIKAAHACGMQTIWFNNMSFEELRIQLLKQGFLKQIDQTAFAIS